MEQIQLSQFIAQLRREIADAINEGEGQSVRFLAETIELELTIGAQKTRDGSGKISFTVFGIGAEGGGGVEQQSAMTQKVKLVLKPVDKDNNSFLIMSKGSGSGQGTSPV